MTTLKDVAKRAGVSAKTVSRVVNRDPMVADSTRADVQRLLATLDYVPNDAARLMRTQSSRTIAFLTDVIATTPYSVDIVRGVQEQLHEAGRTMLIGNSGGDAGQEAGFWRLFQAQRAAGAIYATMFHHAADPEPAGFSAPLVLVNCYDRKRRYACVLPDDRTGGETQARHLLELGHRRIGLVSLNPILVAADLRRDGMLKAHRDFGVSFDASLTRPGMLGPTGGGERLVAYEAALELLSRPDRPTALICGHDQIALQVVAAAMSLGLRIPQDLSVIGFDDQPAITQALRPALTTVALPYYEMGRRAAALLGDGMAGGGALTQTQPVLIDCPLVARASCAAPASGDTRTLRKRNSRTRRMG